MRNVSHPLIGTTLNNPCNDRGGRDRRLVSRRGIIVAALGAVLGTAAPGAADTRQTDYRGFDTSPAWPLCGRISENPPAGWSAEDGCPMNRWGNPDFTDHPIRFGFGPRVLVAEDRYDFHPGIDIPTPSGTPVFAVADGVVRNVRVSDPKVEIQHYRSGAWGGDCKPDGCYHSLYHHLTQAVVAEKQVVRKGQLIGYSGASGSGFEHLHFELRDADAGDASSNWMHNAIHPLRILPYRPDPDGTNVSIKNVDASDPMNPRVTVEIVQRGSTDPAADKRKFDINQVEVQIFDNRSKQQVAQPGLVQDTRGYNLHPPRLDLDLRNQQYVHKDGGSQPWESFDDCPFVHQHGANYSALVHICLHDPENSWISIFNGIRTAPAPILKVEDDYKLTITFEELIGLVDADDLCIVAHVKNVRGGYSARPVTWNCTF